MKDPATQSQAGAPALALHRVGLERNQQHLLHAIDLAVPAGSCTVLLGPNGAGKSLLIRLAHGLLDPTSGTVGVQPSPPPSGVGSAIVFQQPVMLRRSAAANLRHALAAAGIPRRQRGARVAQALERFGLEELARRPARTLSGGEQQRLAVARAWALQPRLLLLDEPTASLDPGTTAAIEAMIAAMHGEGTTLVMATHDIAQARRLADRVAFLHRGRLVEQGPAEAFFQTGPTSAAAAAFLRGELLW